MKKAEVRKLAKLDTGDGVSSVPGVAASLKASGMRSGDQYLNDLKLLHIEERLELPPWLVRVFSLCKKALLRNRGPTRKAVEAKLEDVKGEMWVKAGDEFESNINPAVAYAWACIWMLREIEASTCKWDHAQANGQTRTISLTIPV